MDSWSLQTGYPVVTVRRDYSNQSAILTQERFYLLTNHNSSDFPLWWIPLTFTVDFNATYSAWMMGTEDGIELELPASSDQWIIFNVNQVGYYRVNYDEINWLLLAKQLQEDHSSISVLNRAQLLDDCMNIARVGALSYKVAFEVTRYLRNEREYAPWKAALGAFNYLDRMLYSTPAKEELREYLTWLILPAFEHFGFNQKKNDSGLEILTRDLIISWACRLGVSECINNATTLYKAWMNDSSNQDLINPNYKRSLICAAIADSGDEEWDFALERYLSTDLSSEKEVFIYALSCSKSLEALNTLLEWGLNSKSGIKRQDSRLVFSSVASNPLGKQMAFNFAIKNWDEMVKAFPSLYVLGRLVESITMSLNMEQDLEKLLDLSKGNRGDLGTATRSINQAGETTLINLEWMEQFSDDVAALMTSWSRRQTFSAA